MIYLLYTIHVVVCLFLILVVLLQQGKGADLSVFGGGGTQAAFGARGATTLLHKLTVGSFIAFIVTTIGISLLQGGRSSSSVMAGAAQEGSAPAAAEVAEPATEEAPAVESPAPADEATAPTDAAPAPTDQAPAPADDAGPPPRE